MALTAKTNRLFAMNAYLTRCPAADVYIRERGDSLAKYAVVGSTGQRNIFDLRCYERTQDGTNRPPRLIARAEGRTLATLEGWGDTE